MVWEVRPIHAHVKHTCSVEFKKERSHCCDSVCVRLVKTAGLRRSDTGTMSTSRPAHRESGRCSTRF